MQRKAQSSISICFRNNEKFIHPVIYSLTYSFNQQMSIKSIVYVKHYARCLTYDNKSDKVK